MTLELPYGRSVIKAAITNLPSLDFLDPPKLIAPSEPEHLIQQALSNPLNSSRLEDILHRGERTTIVIPDATRVAGQQHYLPILLGILHLCGIADRDITVLVASGSHALPTPEELREHVGNEVWNRVRVVAHDCRNPEENVHLGHTSRGVPVTLNKAVVKAERLIVTGSVWFHYFAGFGGGPKLINPGCAAYESIVQNHSLTLDLEAVGLHPACRCGNIEGNPVYEDLVDSLKFVVVDFALQTIMGEDNRIVACWAGDLQAAHARAIQFLRENAIVRENGRYGLVIASAGGHPFDINLVQAHKALLNASHFLEPGGTLVLAAECSGGVGSWGLEQSLQYTDPNMLYRILRQEFILNGNTALSLLLKARTYRIILVSDLPPNWVKRLGIIPAEDLEEALAVASELTSVDKALVVPDAAHVVTIG